MSGITFIRPRLAGLSGKGPLNQNLKTLHRAVRERFPYVHRIAVALYNAQTHRINTYLASGDEGKPLAHYQSTLPEAVSLKKVLRERRIRVVDDLNAFEGSHREHTQRIREMGYRSSCTFPLEARGKVRGFLFFNSRKRAAFKKRDIPVLEAYALLATEVATRHLRSACVMLAAIKTAGDLMHFRDPETGYHLDRMARFSRVIAQELGRAGYRDLTDERVQAIEVFAPMHDVGKLAIPDHILKKAAALTPKEKRIMRTHAPLGRRIIDAILKNFGMESFERADALRQIAESHHETLDGKGYPRGLKGKRIPIEARIIAVADVFDALTSERVYKKPWTNDEAFKALDNLSRNKLDRRCVEALKRNRPAVEDIQERFRDAPHRKKGGPPVLEKSHLLTTAHPWC